MDFTQIQQLWSGQPELGSSPAAPNDEARLKAVVAMAARLDRRTKLRDFVEMGTAIGMAALFVWIATLAPIVWPWVAAAVLTLGVGLVFVRERLRAGQPRQEVVDVRRGLERAVAEVNHQIHLLGSVMGWYLAPLGLVVVLVLVGTMLGVRVEVGPDVWARGRVGLLASMGIALLLIGAVFWFVWWLNMRAVRTQLVPHRDELAALLATLDADDVESDS